MMVGERKFTVNQRGMSMLIKLGMESQKDKD
jgi:hypothetical protein